MSYKQLREQCFYKTGREGAVLEVIDTVNPNLFDNNENIDNDIFHKNSKVRFTLVDARKAKEKGKALYFNLDPNEFLLLAYLLSDGIVSSFKKRVGAYNSLSSQEQIYLRNLVETFGSIDFSRFDRNLKNMNYKKGSEGTAIVFQKNISIGGNELLVRKFILSYEEAMRSASKWKITIEEGKGVRDTSKPGGLNIIKRGTYKEIDKTFLMLQIDEVVLPINRSAKRIIFGQLNFYILMKKAEKNFTKRKIENQDYNGEKIDEWNPQGKSKWINENNETKEQIETKKQDSEKTYKNKCSDCGVSISDNVRNFSIKFYQKVLCMDCQRKIKKANI